MATHAVDIVSNDPGTISATKPSDAAAGKMNSSFDNRHSVPTTLEEFEDPTVLEQVYHPSTLETFNHPTKPGTHFSEHGHSFHHVRPMANHSGESVATFFNGLFTTIIGIATLGASVTFSYVLSNNTQSPYGDNPTFDEEQIQSFLAISWLLFLLCLAFAAFGSTLLTFFKKHWVADWDGRNGRTSQWSVQMYAILASSVMGGLIIGAFILLGLVVVAYAKTVGFIAVGFTAFFGLLIMLSILKQTPWPWRDNTPSPPIRHR